MRHAAAKLPVRMCSFHASAASARIAPDHARAEIGELVDVFRGARVMRTHAGALGRKAERQGDVERFERLHLAVEPCLRVRPVPVRPAQAGTQMSDAEPLQPADGAIEAWILEVKPLADAELGRALREARRRAFWGAVLAQQ